MPETTVLLFFNYKSLSSIKNCKITRQNETRAKVNQKHLLHKNSIHVGSTGRNLICFYLLFH